MYINHDTIKLYFYHLELISLLIFKIVCIVNDLKSLDSLWIFYEFIIVFYIKYILYLLSSKIIINPKYWNLVYAALKYFYIITDPAVLTHIYHEMTNCLSFINYSWFFKSLKSIFIQYHIIYYHWIDIYHWKKKDKT